MTQYDLQRGNELAEKIKEIVNNISLLDYALNKEKYNEKLKRFSLSWFGKNKIHIDSNDISFGGYLRVDRECMELIKGYYKNKLEELNAEFESIGKGGVSDA